MQTLKNAEISKQILAHIQAGKSQQEAIDAVLGEGAFMKIAGEVYDALREKGGK